jgi:glycine C-acetyltransferase
MAHRQPWPAICDLADRYDALVMVDDSHAVGFIGEKRPGHPEYCGVMGRVDILTGTLGKALGGASAAATPRAARDHRLAAPALPAVPVLQHPAAVIAAPPARARPAGRSETACEQAAPTTAYFRAEMTAAGFALLPGRAPDHPGDARRRPAGHRAWPSALLAEGVYVIGFSFPVVPMGKARIRTQMSAAH